MSVTKAFVATALALLEDEGKIDLLTFLGTLKRERKRSRKARDETTPHCCAATGLQRRECC